MFLLRVCCFWEILFCGIILKNVTLVLRGCKIIEGSDYTIITVIVIFFLLCDVYGKEIELGVFVYFFKVIEFYV